MLTLRELLADLGIEPLAGERGLGRGVRWVHSSELTDPTPWLSGGELLLTTGLQLGSAAAQRAFVARLADRGVTAIGFGVAIIHDDVPAALVAAARERDLPLFAVPYEMPFIAVAEAAAARLAGAQQAALRRMIAAQERLEQIVLAEHGLGAVGAELGELVGGSVLVFDARGELLARHDGERVLPEPVIDELSGELRERALGGSAQPFGPGAGDLAPRTLALPVSATGRAQDARIAEGSAPPRAWLVAVKDGGALSDLDRFVLRQAVTIIALELLRHRIAEDTERRLAGDVIAATLSGTLAGDELVRRLEPFGIEQRTAALVIAPQVAGGAAVAACERAFAAALRDEGVGGLVAAVGARVCALLPFAPEPDLHALAERIHGRVAVAVEGVPYAGVGRPVAAGQARRTLLEARCALDARALAWLDDDPPGRAEPHPVLATYRDLGSFQLLLSLQDEEALRLFCDSILGSIDAGEGAYGGELMRSLETFIECNGHWERAAGRLYCHRHTLRYRIRKVEDLTGRSLGSARDRIDFWLALRGRELLPAAAGALQPGHPTASEVT